MRRRLLLAVVVVLLVPLIVLGVEVQLARTGGRLADETGFRPDALAVRPGPDPLRVVWLGDSTAAGVGAGEVDASMAHRVAAGIADGPATLTILAVSGAQVHEVLDGQLPELAGTAADVVFVSIGANDVTALTRQPTFRARYRRLVDGIRDAVPDAELYLVGIPDIGTAPRLAVPLRQIAGVRAAQLDDEIEEIAADAGLVHIDLASRTSSTFSADPDRYFADDGYHPSADGHEVWADAILAALADR